MTRIAAVGGAQRSIARDDLGDFRRSQPLSKGERQQDARFLRVERVGRNEAATADPLDLGDASTACPTRLYDDDAAVDSGF